MKNTKEDPWKHRSSGMKCTTCMWYVEKAVAISGNGMQVDQEPVIGDINIKGSIGRCRRHAPTINGYPVVFDVDWCGDHKLDETKMGGE